MLSTTDEVWLQDLAGWSNTSTAEYVGPRLSKTVMVLPDGRQVSALCYLEPDLPMCGRPAPPRAVDVAGHWKNMQCCLPPDHDCPHVALWKLAKWRILSLEMRCV